MTDWIPLRELREGAVFETQDGIRAVKSEYHNANGRIQCILLASGEYAGFKHGDDELVRGLHVVASDRERTHWDNCWRNRSHWRCCVARVERLEVELADDGWINVEERLPVEDEKVLGYVRRDRKATGLPYYTFDFVEWRGDRWMNVNESGYWLWSNATVTHWQYLEPPKEASDD